MNKKKKYIFNDETTNYEEIKVSFGYRLIQFLFHLLIGLVFGFLFFLLFVILSKSSKEKKLLAEKTQIEAQYKMLRGEINQIQVVLNDLQERDDNLYRVVFQAEPIPIEARHTPTSNIKYYNDLLKKTNSKIVIEITNKINSLKKQIYVQSKSYDEILHLVKNRDKMLQALPAIQPVANKDLKRLASGFGYRYDPIYHTRRFHKGMDFSAPRGTEIYATGNAKVAFAGWNSGYGKCVYLNHGYGYVTRYAHMSKIKVKKGQKVKRGQVIGLVGNTGKSTGPHLHYEVRKNGKVMNPKNYYFLDLTPEEYERLIQISENSGQMLD